VDVGRSAANVEKSFHAALAANAVQKKIGLVDDVTSDGEGGDCSNHTSSSSSITSTMSSSSRISDLAKGRDDLVSYNDGIIKSCPLPPLKSNWARCSWGGSSWNEQEGYADYNLGDEVYHVLDDSGREGEQSLDVRVNP